MVLKNGKILLNGKLVKKDIKIKKGKIVDIADEIPSKKAIDLKGKFISSGLIDVHVHFRSPGFEYKEDIKTGSKSAAKGGFTTVCTMPNVFPVPSNLENLKKQLKLIKKYAVVKILPYGAITNKLEGEKLADFEGLREKVCAFTDDGIGVQSMDLMEKAMKEAKRLDKMIVAHCEDEQYIESDNERAEYEQVKRDIELASRIGCKYHICHISTKESIEFVRQAKAKGIGVTCEVTPHHLLLTDEDVNNDPNFKMNPPLRSEADKKACIAGIIDGTIDMIATDHAPHSEEEKSRTFDKAPNGIVGLETAFPLMYTKFVKTNVISLEKLMKLMVFNPANIFDQTNFCGFNSAGIEIGGNADLAVFDLEKEFVVNKNEFESKAKNTPFNEYKLYGETYLTIVDGEIVYRKS